VEEGAGAVGRALDGPSVERGEDELDARRPEPAGKIGGHSNGSFVLPAAGFASLRPHLA
jgi:hypothetical protein